MRSRIFDLFQLVGKGVYGLVLGTIPTVYGAVQIVTEANKTGWFWVSVGFAAFILVAFYVAYQALGERDKAIAQVAEVEAQPPMNVGAAGIATAPGATGIRADRVTGTAGVPQAEQEPKEKQAEDADEENDQRDLPA